MSIQNSALLVTPHICRWSNTKTDKRLSRSIQSDMNAQEGTLRLRKTLVDAPEVKALTKLAGHIRNNIVGKLTIPWSDDGTKLLTIELMDRFEQEMEKATDEWSDLVFSLMVNYDSAVQNARQSLGKAFDEKDYPATYEIRDKYSVTVQYSAVPDGDIRVNIPQAKLDKLVDAAKDEINTKIQASMKTVHERVATTLNHLILRLEEFGVDKNGKATGVFRDSTVTNLTDLVEILPALNVTGDPVLTEVSNDLLEKLQFINPESLRLNETTRKKTAKDARAIVSKLEGLY